MQEWVSNNWFYLGSLLVNIVMGSFIGGKLYFKVVSALKNIATQIEDINTAKKEQDLKIAELKEKYYETERSLVNIKHTEELREVNVKNNEKNINSKLSDIIKQNQVIIDFIENLKVENNENDKRITILENKN